MNKELIVLFNNFFLHFSDLKLSPIKPISNSILVKCIYLADVRGMDYHAIF